MADSDDRGFLSRWSRRKAQARLANEPAESPLPAPALPTAQAPEPGRPETVPEVAAAKDANEPALTLADVAQLTPDSDFTRFVAGGVQTEVKNAALKKLFSDPHFNLTDGLDVYIDDYNAPDPLPPSMLGKMALTRFLSGDSEAPPAQRIAAHENADLQLQPHDDAGRPSAAPSADGDTGREC